MISYPYQRCSGFYFRLLLLCKNCIKIKRNYMIFANYVFDYQKICLHEKNGQRNEISHSTCQHFRYNYTCSIINPKIGLGIHKRE